MPTIGEVLETIKARAVANPDKIGNLTAIYQFELTGEGGGTFHVRFVGGVADVGEGPADNPGCTLVLSTPDFLSLAGGKLNPTAAFMTGKLKLKGDMGLAMKLQTVLG